MPYEDIEGSRSQFTIGVLRAANSDQLDSSGLPEGIRKVVSALLDPREYSTPQQHADACDEVAELLRPAGVLLERSGETVELRISNLPKSASVLDKQIHTIFGAQLTDEALSAARVHYRKAERYTRGPNPDYENACKESVCTIESIVLALSPGVDFVKTIRGLSSNGVISAPIGEMVIKLYAYRGDEPGVTHGGPNTPAVGAIEAELLFNLAGALGAYFRAKLTEPAEQAS